jgi:hypothetical protein
MHEMAAKLVPVIRPDRTRFSPRARALTDPEQAIPPKRKSASSPTWLSRLGINAVTAERAAETPASSRRAALTSTPIIRIGVATAASAFPTTDSPSTNAELMRLWGNSEALGRPVDAQPVPRYRALRRPPQPRRARRSRSPRSKRLPAGLGTTAFALRPAPAGLSQRRQEHHARRASRAIAMPRTQLSCRARRTAA